MFSGRHFAYTTVFLTVFASPVSATPDFDVTEIDVDHQLASLPRPPDIEPITTADILEITSHSAALQERSAYLPAIVQEATANNVPPALVDAVVRIESRYDPMAVGSVGEVGLMQVRPKTAALLGFQGASADLAEPRTNLRYGVSYLARAWRLAGGNLCRALMKYRAGHGAERMSTLSLEYCRRARLHLAAVGARLTAGDEPSAGALKIPRDRGLQLNHAGKRTAAAAVRQRHDLNRSFRLTVKQRVEPAHRASATTARASISSSPPRRMLRLVRQAPVWTVSHRPLAHGNQVAYR